MAVAILVLEHQQVVLSRLIPAAMTDEVKDVHRGLLVWPV